MFYFINDSYCLYCDIIYSIVCCCIRISLAVGLCHLCIDQSPMVYRASVNIYSSLSCNGNLFFISDGSVFVPGPVPVSCHVPYGSIADYSWSPPQPSVLHYIIPKRDRVQSSSLINFYMIYGERRYEINQYDEVKVKESININLMDLYIPSCFFYLYSDSADCL